MGTVILIAWQYVIPQSNFVQERAQRKQFTRIVGNEMNIAIHIRIAQNSVIKSGSVPQLKQVQAE